MVVIAELSSTHLGRTCQIFLKRDNRKIVTTPKAVDRVELQKSFFCLFVPAGAGEGSNFRHLLIKTSLNDHETETLIRSTVYCKEGNEDVKEEGGGVQKESA